MQIWAESGKSALPICNYSQILYQFLTFTQNLKRSLPQSSVARIESCKTTPNLGTLLNIFQHLGLQLTVRPTKPTI